MTLDLTSAQRDRAAGVLLGQACGDALGVPYEFARPPASDQLAEMLGGGLGDFEPGEWSDDTSMAVAVGEGLLSGMTDDVDPLDAVADRFLAWYGSGPADVGIQTSAVLAGSGRSGPGSGATMSEAAAAYARSHPRSAGNGALMRTGVVALAHLHDRDALAAAARDIASLTHADPLAGDSCVLWCEAVRIAVLDARVDARAGLDLVPAERREQWSAWLDDALDVERNRVEPTPGARFTPNGFTVTALQAAVAAVVTTAVPDEDAAAGSFACLHLQDALHAAVRIGNDTDTVAAIAGALLGARWGASAVPWRWRRAVHGWPGRDGRDLVAVASLLASGGSVDPVGWPTTPVVDYPQAPRSTRPVLHPHDDGVLLGTVSTREHEADAVVSLCRVGREQPSRGDAGEVVESRVIDTDDPTANAHLAFGLHDAADAVRGLRAEGKRVFLHCVAAEQRTPSVAIAYSRLLGVPAAQARADVLAALPGARGRGRLWDAAADVAPDAPSVQS